MVCAARGYCLRPQYLKILPVIFSVRNSPAPQPERFTACRSNFAAERLKALAGALLRVGATVQHQEPSAPLVCWFHRAGLRRRHGACLPEHPVLVTDAITPGGQRQSRHGVQEAGRKAPQAAVAERSIPLLLNQVLQLVPHLAQRLCAATQRIDANPPQPVKMKQAISRLCFVQFCHALKAVPPTTHQCQTDKTIITLCSDADQGDAAVNQYTGPRRPDCSEHSAASGPSGTPWRGSTRA